MKHTRTLNDTQKPDYQDVGSKVKVESCDKNFASFAVKPSQRL